MAVTYYGKNKGHFNVRSSDHIGIANLSRKSIQYKQTTLLDLLLLHNCDSNFNDIM